MTGGCPDCGIDASSIDVPDAVGALRTFPRRFREGARRVLEAVPAGAGAAAGIVGRAAGALERDRDLLDAALTRPDAVIEPPPPAAPAATVNDGLVRVETAAAALVERADRTPWEAWDRSVVVGDARLSARGIVQDAAHAGAHALRGLERLAPFR